MNRLVRLALLNIALSSAMVAAGPQTAAEYQVKAAFLLNFTKFVEWPSISFATSGSPISICILGDDPFGRTLDQVVEGETVDDHRLSIHRIRQAPAPGTCHVLFVETNKKDLAHTLAEVEPGVLTVGEGDEFLREGGIIAFVIDNRRVRFDINQSAAAKAELKLNARLLSVARAVEK
jgi:YfiR/HmsC-like